LDATSFYTAKRIVSTEWWVSAVSLPELHWARLRVFSDDTADASFDGRHAVGFSHREYAVYYLSEDDYTPVATLDAEDEAELGRSAATLVPPEWTVEPESFKYLGTY